MKMLINASPQYRGEILQVPRECTWTSELLTSFMNPLVTHYTQMHNVCVRVISCIILIHHKTNACFMFKHDEGKATEI